jgi:hypothetical protein
LDDSKGGAIGSDARRRRMARTALRWMICLLTFAAPLRAMAIAPNQLQLGTGALFYNFNNTTDSADGSLNFFGPTYLLPVQARFHLTAYENLLFSPRLMYTLLPRESDDGSVKTSVLLLSFPISARIPSWPDLSWTVGFGYMVYQIDGQGGSVVLNDASTSRTFTRPSGSATINMWNLEMGVGYAWERFQFDAELFIGQLTDAEQLTSHLMLTASYSLEAM